MKVTSEILKIRFVRKNQDFDRIVEIDCNTSGEYRWEPEDIFKLLNDPWAVGIVAVDTEDYPLGFCLYSLNNHGEDTFEIKHLVVDKIYHRLGIATHLMNKMKTKLSASRHLINYDVPETNHGMHLFLSKMGFSSKLIRQNNEDIYRFTYGSNNAFRIL